MAVRWVRCLAPFQALAPQDQLVLLRAAWKDLFLLHLAQWSAPWDLSPLLAAPAARARLPPDPLADLELNTLQVRTVPDVSSSDCRILLKHVEKEAASLKIYNIRHLRHYAPSHLPYSKLTSKRSKADISVKPSRLFQEILCRFRQISPDGSECGCMKAIVLFSPGKLPVLFHYFH